eukprot:8339577-Pyramimonas_sp.AAC.1
MPKTFDRHGQVNRRTLRMPIAMASATLARRRHFHPQKSRQRLEAQGFQCRSASGDADRTPSIVFATR